MKLFRKSHLPIAYRRTVIAVPLFALIYVGIVSTQHWLHDHGEIFPFFNWSLFSTVSKNTGRVSVRVLAVNDSSSKAALFVGKVIMDPRDLKFLRNISFQKTTHRFYNEFRKRDIDALEKTKKLLENFVFPSYGITSFELVYISYDPIELYFDKKIKGVTTIAKITISEPLIFDE